MSLPLIAIRPEPGLSATLAAANELGLSIRGFALFDVVPLAWQAPPKAEVDALLLGGANALRLGGAALALYRAMPAHVVGETTSAAARAAELAVASSGAGGLQQVLDALAGQTLRLLRLAGAEHVELAVPAGITIITRIVYETVPVPLPEACAAVLRHGAVVLLHSAAAARHFAGECDRLGVARGGVRLAALGQRIADAAGAGWAEVRAAATPQDSALLALARDMCQ